MNQVQVYFCLAFVSVIGFILVSRYWNSISPKINKILNEETSLNQIGRAHV